MEKTGDYSKFNKVTNLRDFILELNPKLTKRQIKRVKEGVSSTRNSILFLNLVNESKILTLQSGNLIKSHRNFREQSSKHSMTMIGAKELINNATLNL